MPREAKPYVERGWYVSRAGGRYLKLCRVEQGVGAARAELRRLLVEMDRERERTGGRLAGEVTVEELFARFLADTERMRSRATYLDYRHWCTAFARLHGRKPARQVTTMDATAFRAHMCSPGAGERGRYRPKTVNHALIAVRRAFNWGIKAGYLPAGTNPFAGIELLRCRGRERVATEEEFRKLLAACTDDAFRDVLVAMRHTSARPQDVYNLTWDMVDWAGRMWVLPEHKTSRTARDPKPRVIGMGDEVERVLRRRAGEQGEGRTGPVFRNAAGRPWTKDALGLRMRRLRQKAGVGPDARGEAFVLYTHRHTFLTRAAENPNLSEAMLMRVAGHTDPRTTHQYIHPQHRVVADAGRAVADGLSGSAPAGAG